MSFKLSELLNPAPNTDPTSPQDHDDAPEASQRSHQNNEDSYTASAYHYAAPTTLYEAADALTALATSGTRATNLPFAQHFAVHPSGGSQYGLSRSYSDDRPTSSYSQNGAPLGLSPSLAQRPFSPSQDLDQYHHNPKSPDEQRRQSIFTRESPPPRLAPIKSLPGSMNGNTQEFESWRRGSASQIGFRPMHVSSPQMAHWDTIDRAAQARELPFYSHGLHTMGASPDDSLASVPSAQVKSEPTATPRVGTPMPHKDSLDNQIAVPPGEDTETLKAIAALKNEHGTRTAARDRSQRELSATVVETPQVNLKKRPAPRSQTKKGMASTVTKPPAKKRKVENNGVVGTSVHRSETPMSQASRARAVRVAGSVSATPAASSPPPASPAPTYDVSASEPEDGADVFCICRKPDNHTWMIACDGTCDDWYHGKCVNIDESDGALIDKYICPVCEEKGIGNTTWKPMCRNDGCRNPARLHKGNFSKYCREECGRDFFAKKIGLSPMGKKRSNRKSKHISAEMDGEDLGPLGGPIRARDLKALTDAAFTVENFKSLGDPASVIVMPPTATTIALSDVPLIQSEPPFTPEEQAQLSAITQKKAELRRKRGLLKDKERFLAMTKLRSTQLTADVLGIRDTEWEKPANKKAMNEICGYDPRLTWDVEEFRKWREESDAGRRAFQTGALDLPAEAADKPLTNGIPAHEHDHPPPNEDAADGPPQSEPPGVNGAGTALEQRRDPPVCMRKRCERHKQWQKLALQDVRFEEADVGDEMRRVEREERDLVERAVLRERMKKGGAGDDGTVERVGGEEKANGVVVQGSEDGRLVEPARTSERVHDENGIEAVKTSAELDGAVDGEC